MLLIYIVHSISAERLISRLCSIEFALRPMTSEAILCRAKWQATEELELLMDTASGSKHDPR